MDFLRHVLVNTHGVGISWMHLRVYSPWESNAIKTHISVPLVYKLVYTNLF